MEVSELSGVVQGGSRSGWEYRAKSSEEARLV